MKIVLVFTKTLFDGNNGSYLDVKQAPVEVPDQLITDDYRLLGMVAPEKEEAT